MDRTAEEIAGTKRAPGLLTPLLLVGVWAVLYLPALITRGLHYEEGRRALAAMDMLEQGRWLLPQVLGLDYLSKPPLLPWVIAAVGWLQGGVDAVAVRFLPLAATLASAIAAAVLLRRAGLDRAAPIAGLAVLLTPMILEKGAVGETDTTVTAAVFIAFVVWWSGRSQGRVGAGRWLICTVLLALAALTKGPIPLGFFAGGVLVHMAVTRRLDDLPGLVTSLLIALVPVGAWALLVHQPGTEVVWQAEMRLSTYSPGVIDYLASRLAYLGELVAVLAPWGVLALPAVVPAWRRRLGIDPALAAVLAGYILAFGVAVSLSPMAVPRYLMPAVPAIAVLAAMTAEALIDQRWMRRALTAACAVLALAQIGIVSGVIPFRPDLYSYAERAGQELASAIGDSPSPVFLVAPFGDHNIVFYTGRPVTHVQVDQRDAVPTPAWVITTPEALAAVDGRLFDDAGPTRADVAGRRDVRFVLLPRGDP